MKALNERNIIFEVQVKQIKTKVVNEKIQIDCRNRYVSKYTVLKIKFTDLNDRLLQFIVTIRSDCIDGYLLRCETERSFNREFH